MYTRPNAESLIDGALHTLVHEIGPSLPEVEKVKLEMVLVLLQNAKQIVPVEQQAIAAEHNAVLDLYADLLQAAQNIDHPEASKLRANLADVCTRKKFAEMPARSDLLTAHYEVSKPMKATLEAIHSLLVAGKSDAEAMLTRVRRHLSDRIGQEFALYAVNPGSMPGRK